MCDIQYGINFCLKNNIRFTFRYASFRKDDLITFYNVNFDELFDTSFLSSIDLYVNINTLNLNNDNTDNFNSIINANTFLKNNIKFLKYIKKPYVVLKGIFSLIKDIEISKNILSIIQPSPKIMNIYKNTFYKLGLNNEPYNFIHYRYEHDFRSGHRLKNIPSLKLIVKSTTFKNNKYKIYIAASDINKLLSNIDTTEELCCKNEEELKELNYEQRAFIDFMFGMSSIEVYGHPMSSFSIVLNTLKNTNNYY